MASAVASAPTGLDLRLRRTMVGATQTEIARALSVSRQRVGHIESTLRPPAASVSRYLHSLDEVTSARRVRASAGAVNR